MKRITIFFLAFLLMAKSHAIPPGLWLQQLVGRTCVEQVLGVEPQSNWPPNGPEGLCWKKYKIVCTSWLWGVTESIEYGWGTCQGAGGIVTPPSSNGNLVNDKIAEFYTIQLANNITGVNPAWTNPDNLNDQAVLNAAVIFRLRLAGYDANENWLTEAGACLFNAGPTLPIIVPLSEVPTVDCN